MNMTVWQLLPPRTHCLPKRLFAGCIGRSLMALFSLLFSLGAVAEVPLIDLNRLDGIRSVNSQMKYTTNADVSLQSLLSDSVRSDWQEAAGQLIFPRGTQNLWFHARLVKTGPLPDTTLLRVDYAHLDQVNLYFVSQGELIRQYNTGDTLPFADRPVQHRVFLFPLNDLPDTEVDVYLRVASEGLLQIPVDVLTRADLDQQDKQLFLLYGAFFGILIVMLLYNAVIYTVVREQSYLYYLLFVAASGMLQFVLLGFGAEYLWPQSGRLNNVMTLLLTGLLPLTAVLFVDRFLSVRQLGNRFEQWVIKALMALFTLNILLGGILSYSAALTFSHILSLVAVTVGFQIGVTFSLRGIRSARTFAAAWFLYLVFISLYLLDVSMLVPSNLLSRHALPIGSVLELVLLSLAFGDRINEEKELRLRTQKTLNQELDLLVRQRTEELEQANAKLLEVSNTDGLTQLRNRRYFDEVFAVECKRSLRDRSPVSILLIDIDHFKNLNDSYGHHFGDLCLIQAAQIVHHSIRRPPDLAARYGGEEFVVLLPNTNLDGAVQVAEKIQQRIRAVVVEQDGHRAQMTFSIGVASLAPHGQDTPEQILQQADVQLYRAKQLGRDRVEWKQDQEDQSVPNLLVG